MRTKVSSITLLAGILLILVADISLAQGEYDPQAAVSYATTWDCEGCRNTDEYLVYDADCANFISQCLIAGGLDLMACTDPDVWTDARGCITSCTDLDTYLRWLSVNPKCRLVSEGVPEWLKAGDVIILACSPVRYQHAMIVVKGEAANALYSGHSQDQEEISFSQLPKLLWDKYINDYCETTHINYYNIRRAFSGAGSGTEQDPYIITNVQQLQEMNDDLSAWYELGNDIDASETSSWNSGAGFIPIGTGPIWIGNPFMGHLDGKGHVVSGLYINRAGTDYVGLFGCSYYNEIKDVGLRDVDITGGNYVGGLIGLSGYAGSRTRCYTTGRVSGGQSVGGLMGVNGRTDISDCYSTASVSGDSDVGGLIGANQGYSGATSTYVNVSHCYSAGLVNNGVSGDNVGGLVGYSRQTRWNSCYWDVEGSGQTTSAGGLGKTTMEMKWQVTYMFASSPWDFDTVWNIQEDITYPFLRIFDDEPQAPPPSQIFGSGTEQDPFIITNVKELQAMNNHLHAWYALGNDIDASETSSWYSGAGFIPIGTGPIWIGNPFMGHLDGKGHVVSGLYINRAGTDYVGLFGCSYYNEIKDVGLRDVDITGGNYVGGLIGLSGYAGSRTRCYTTGRVSGGQSVGGLMGVNGRTDISDCYSTASVSGDSDVGGLIGANQGYSGATSTYVNVSHCYSVGLVNNGVSGDNVGGLVGYSRQTHWNSCYWDIETSAQDTSDGGLGKTTTEMKQQATFFGWDFNTVWDIVEGQSYPFLRGFGVQEPPGNQPLEKNVRASYIISEPLLVPPVEVELAFGKMTVSYNWIRDETYVVTKVNYESKGFIGYARIEILNVDSHSEPQVKWKDDIFNFGQEAKDYYPNIEVDAIDEMQVVIIGWADIPFGSPFEIIIGLKPFVRAASVAFDPDATPEYYPDIQPIHEELELARLASPGEIRVFDSQGRVTGLVGGAVKEEIPNTAYGSDAVIMLSPVDVYRYQVVGTEEGTYGLSITSVSGGEAVNFEANDIPTSPESVHQYTIDWNSLSAGEEGVILEIDNDGDGVFVQMVIADNDLSYDEFALQTETVVDFDPDTLNLNSQGKFATVYIELPEDIDVSEIEISSLTLNESVPALQKPFEIGDYDSDGINDLMVKFDLRELIELLEPGEQIIDLTGRLWDGRPIAGFDFIRVIH